MQLLLFRQETSITYIYWRQLEMVEEKIHEPTMVYLHILPRSYPGYEDGMKGES